MIKYRLGDIVTFPLIEDYKNQYFLIFQTYDESAHDTRDVTVILYNLNKKLVCGPFSMEWIERRGKKYDQIGNWTNS